MRSIVESLREYVDFNEKKSIFIQGGYFEGDSGIDEFSKNTASLALEMSNYLKGIGCGHSIKLGVLVNDLGMVCGTDVCDITSNKVTDYQVLINEFCERYPQFSGNVKTEHKCVLASCSEMANKGFEVVFLDVDSSGLIDLQQLEAEICNDTILVSVMYGNNETGVLQPIKEISQITKRHKVPLHCDATQSMGLLKLNVQELGVDMLTFSGHKIYGPKGIGALYIKSHVKINALIHGGQQEKGLRGGTYNVPGIVGLASALSLSRERQEHEYLRLSKLRERFLSKVTILKPVSNTPIYLSLPHCISLSLPNVNMQKMLPRLKKVILSTGSACNSGDQKESHVLMAMGLGKDLANSTIRISFGRDTTIEDVDAAAEEIIYAASISKIGEKCEKLET